MKSKISEYLIAPNETVLDAMKKIDRNAKGIVYICEGQNLSGVLTDGDVRRFILKNGDLNQPVSHMANQFPKYIHTQDKELADNIMKQYRIRSIPVLNGNMELDDIYFLEKDEQNKKPQLHIPVVIMAGGKGTRLYPYTQILPKPLIPIGEKTITEHIMDKFHEYGCSHFDMIINYKKNFIKSYFTDNEYQRDIHFVEEEHFLGTGGGLSLLAGKYFSSFFMSNCDILVEADYADILRFHKKQRNIATMVCAMKHVIIPYGTVDIAESGQVLKLNEKPELSFVTNTGLYLLEPAFLDEIPKDTFIHITDVLQNCINSGKRVGVYPITEDKWLDMGQLDELERMKKNLKM